MATRDQTPYFNTRRGSRAPAGANRKRRGSMEMLVMPTSQPANAPEWVGVVTQVKAALLDIRSRMARLMDVQRKLLVPLIEPTPAWQADEKMAARLNDEIPQLIKSTGHLLSQIAIKRHPQLSEDERARLSAYEAFVPQLQTLATEFRRSQLSYVDKMQALNSDPPEPVINHGFNVRQQALIAESDAIIEERHRAIEDVVKSVEELASMFKDVHTLVVEQGAMLDCIEENINQTVVHTRAANVELTTANKYDKQYQKKLMLFLILFIIILGVYILANKFFQ